MTKRGLGLLWVLLHAGTAGSTVFLVKSDGTGDFPTIQAAIDGAQDGDVIELADGTYTGAGNRDILYNGRLVTVRSRSGDPTACVIDCEGDPLDPHFGFNFDAGETRAVTVSGLTIRHGYANGTT